MTQPIVWTRGRTLADLREQQAEVASLTALAPAVCLLSEQDDGRQPWNERDACLDLTHRILRNGAAQTVIMPSLQTIGVEVQAVAAFVSFAAHQGAEVVSLQESLSLRSEQGQSFIAHCRALLKVAEDEPLKDRSKRLTRSRFGFRYGQAEGSVYPPAQGTPEQLQLVPNPAEQTALACICELMGSMGALPLGKAAHQAAKELNAQGIAHPRTGKPWAAGSVKNIYATFQSRQRDETDRIVSAATADLGAA